MCVLPLKCTLFLVTCNILLFKFELIWRQAAVYRQWAVDYAFRHRKKIIINYWMFTNKNDPQAIYVRKFRKSCRISVDIFSMLTVCRSSFRAIKFPQILVNRNKASKNVPFAVLTSTGRTKGDSSCARWWMEHKCVTIRSHRARRTFQPQNK